MAYSIAFDSLLMTSMTSCREHHNNDDQNMFESEISIFLAVP